MSLLLGAACLLGVLVLCAVLMGTLWSVKREQELSRARSAADTADVDTDVEPDIDALHPQGHWWDSVAGR